MTHPKLKAVLTFACLLGAGACGDSSYSAAPEAAPDTGNARGAQANDSPSTPNRNASPAADASAEAASTAVSNEAPAQLSPELAARIPADLFTGSRSREIMAVQVRLDQARFSPGPIDGVAGSNTARAIRAFERAHGMQVDGELDPELVGRLEAMGSGAVLKSYTIQQADVAGPFVDSIPADMTGQAKLDRLAYTSPQELLAEKFHMSLPLLQALNPQADFGRSGTEILVAAAGGDKLQAAVSRIVVDKTREEVRAYSGDGELLARYPATIGSQTLPSPSGSMKVRAIAPDPAYYFDPKGRSWGPNKKLKIAPGPNNPVGAMWIDLTKEGYGIHGSPHPRKISKQASHGCVRLTNWDAQELGSAEVVGAEVTFTS